MTPKVLFCIPAYSYGGIESNTELICKFAAEYGYTDFGLCVEKQNLDVDFSFYKEHGWKIFILPHNIKFNPIRYYRLLTKIIQQNGYNIVHSFNETRSPIVFRAAKRSGVKVRIYHPRTTKHDHGFYRKFGVYLSMKYATNLCACSKNVGLFTFKNKHFDIINDAIDTDKYLFSDSIRREVRLELGISDDKIVIGHIGRFCIAKNHEFLVRTFVAAVKKGLNAHLVLVGSGELYNDVCKLINEQGITDKVTLLGQRNDAYKLYQAFDLFLFPSVYEGYPNTVIEAQTSGLKCLLSNVITKDVAITDNVERLSLNIGAEAWADKIIEMSTPYIRLGHKQEVIDAGNDAATEVRHLLDLYDSWLNKK